MSTLEHLLRKATLKLESRGPGSGGVIEGTGFLVAPGIVATCAHVLADRREELPSTVAARTDTGRELLLEAVPEWYLREQAGGLDLAFLRAPSDTGPHVLLSGVVEAGESVWTWGHPAGRFRAGQSALFTAQGPSRLRAVDADGRPLGEEWQPERVFGTPVGGGYSGSAVLSRRTGAVCGMLFSHKAGSAHMVSAADILSALAQIAPAKSGPVPNKVWLEQLDDEQIRIGGWPYPGPRLRAYLDAAILMAREHPYPGMVPGTRPPPLTTVHLRQQAETATTTTQDGADASSRQHRDAPAKVSAHQVLDQDGNAVVIAGPGGGKSTFLRTGLIAMAERWRTEQSGRSIPVLVPAADLAPPRPLHEALADSVAKGLSTAAPAHDWSSHMFKTEPLRGVSWLVMVDGLDEITDPAVRRDLITKLENASARPGSPYRFIVATRPLPPTELPETSSGDWPRRHALLPFTTEGLGQFAKQWFTALNLPDPAHRAQQFVGELRRRRLEGLARTPLMATLLCQLYSTHPHRPLPDSRGQIYQDFVNLLYLRQRAAGLRAQTRTSLQEYGDEVLAAAERTLQQLQNLIAELADSQYEGSMTPALDLIASAPAAARPERVPEAEWRMFLEECLRSSGLMTASAGEPVFLHRTLLEYLAARHATHNRRFRALLYRLVLYEPGSRNIAELYFRGLGDVHWRPPPKDADSYVGFLIDLGRDDTKNLPRFLKHMATKGGIEGCAFLVRQVQLGTYLPEPITQAAADTLSELACDPRLRDRDRVWSAAAMAELGDARAVDLLASLALEEHLNRKCRVDAALELASLDRQRGLQLVALLALFPEVDLADRIRAFAAKAVAELGDERAVGLLASLAQDAYFASRVGVEAAQQVARLDRQRGIELLSLLTLDADLEGGRRVAAAKAVAELGDERASDLLASLAQDADLNGWRRIAAAETLAKLGDERAADLLRLLSGEKPVEWLIRKTLTALFGSSHN